MAGLLSELGRRAVDRWFPSLALPGLVYVSLAAVGILLGHRHWAETELLTSRLSDLAGPATQADSPRTVLLLLVVLASSVGSALVARTLGRALESLLSGPWPGPLSRLSDVLTARRARAWASAEAAYQDAAVPPPVDSAFQLAGYGQAVGTLWEIGDGFAASVAPDFYGRLSAGTEPGARLPAAVALHNTTRGIRAALPRLPSAWAALVHAGA